ncbi:MAG: hypothetical protein P1P90_01015 [Patescibacteria group bacterium]|nr:hypothetical protein [Patescibacteria group bacterium]
MPYLSQPPEPILRDAIEQTQLTNFRRIIKHFGWNVIPFKLFQHSLTTCNFSPKFNLEWLHTFYEVYATPLEKKEMLNAGYQPRS